MPSKIDITGQIFGKLKAIKRASEKPGMWLCLCECGKNKDVYISHLRSGGTSSCGCLRKTPEDLCGKVFRYLTAQKYLYSKNDHHYWECVCECGNIIVSTMCNLKKKNTRSCGCKANDLQEETNLVKYGRKSSFQNKNVREKFEQTNLKRYGVRYPAQNKDIALKTAKSQKNTYILYHWKTNEELVCQASYEKKVVEYLNKNKIDFKWQHRVFSMVVSSGKQTTYRPDLYIIGRRKPWIEIKGYFRKDAKEKWDTFQTIKPNSELWDKSKLVSMGIL